MNDISPDWNGCTAQQQRVIKMILGLEGTPLAILAFDENKHVFDNYWYWFILSTLWVSYSGYSDISLWRRLFQSRRPQRLTSIMKPSELRAYRLLPDELIVYRAHRPDETDWISYTIDRGLADRWVQQRGGHLGMYTLHKKDCLALFLRRGENEILMLEPSKSKLIGGVRHEA